MLTDLEQYDEDGIDWSIVFSYENKKETTSETEDSLISEQFFSKTIGNKTISISLVVVNKKPTPEEVFKLQMLEFIQAENYEACANLLKNRP